MTEEQSEEYKIRVFALGLEEIEIGYEYLNGTHHGSQEMSNGYMLFFICKTEGSWVTKYFPPLGFWRRVKKPKVRILQNIENSGSES